MVSPAFRVILYTSMTEKQPSPPSSITGAMMKKAATILTRRAHSRGELRRKLTRICVVTSSDSAAITSQIEEVLDRLEHLDLLNDINYAYNFSVYHLKESGWGPARIRAALRRQEVAEKDIEQAIARVFTTAGNMKADDEPTDGDLNDVSSALMGYIENYCRKKGMSKPFPVSVPVSVKDVQRLARHLSGHGFDEAAIRDALAKIVPPEVFRKFEGE